MSEKGKLIIFSAPSGAGKTSIVRGVMDRMPCLGFSVSACSRPKRKGEKHGVDYYFLSPDEFREKINKGLFLEWEEVYPGSYYGTLISEVERIWSEGKHVVFDVDVAGGLNIKRQYPERTLAVFIAPPSLDILRQRLIDRKTESRESLEKRLSKAGYEISFSKEFDKIIINDKLHRAIDQAEEEVRRFIDTEN